MGANMTDVAKAAGVSIATVGRVIHKNGYVSQGARERVEKAVRELGYVPNALARALKKKSSGVIGSLVAYSLNNLFQKINNSVIEAAEEHGYELVTIEARPGRGEEARIVNRFIGMRVDAIVITSNRFVPPEVFRALREEGIPVVCVERNYDFEFVDNLTVSDFEGGRSAVARMAARGHRRIALIAKELVDIVEVGRHEGYRAALRDAGIEIDGRLIRLVKQYERQYGYEEMRALMALKDPPTAVFVTADTMAAGAMQYLYEAGLRIPDDVSIAGYDNVISALLSPPIDSVDLATADIGETVVELIERRLNRPDAPGERRMISTVYVDRGTVKEIQGGRSE
jgi:LacI family transcriptional regulator